MPIAQADPIPETDPRQTGPGRSLGILLLKPSRYDDDGYVVEWKRVFMPAHSLSAVAGIVQDALNRGCLGGEVTTAVSALDETQGRASPEAIARQLKRYDRALVMMIGVQTNQFLRACDLGRRLVALGIPTVIGGFHVSGTLRMTPGWKGGRLEEAQNDGMSLYAGELETGIDQLLQDALNGTVKPLYDMLDAEVDLRQAPNALIGGPLSGSAMTRVVGADISRGCPFKCSFCSIINVHGNTMRVRSAEAIETYLTEVARSGRREVFIVDDNFARIKNWREVCDVFETVARREGVDWELMIQVDTLAYRLPGFIEAVKRAGCKRVFIGIESVDQATLKAAAKGQNKINLMPDMVMAWKRAGIIIYSTMITGFPGDTVESIKAQMTYVRENLPVDLMEFFFLTPLPGSVDHQRMVEAGKPFSDELNDYDSEHVLFDHENMTKEEWETLYRELWEDWYSCANMARVVDNGVKYGLPRNGLILSLLGFRSAVLRHHLHPLQAGIWRRKRRTERRPGLPIEPRWSFYPQRVYDIITIALHDAAICAFLYATLARSVLRHRGGARKAEQMGSPQEAQ
ncbi:B12-binding domain-containing radical SAM protein [Pseudodonghicola flavimaris]|uniref:Radical SAM protein n=1 Tax=Pseudodonghicola flavimaris TaxID=3050036 RepID=A0ABT7F1T7_9RHOB|nr:radical SAM protein [Pseudodonghicola flavimaris]MDK3018568.1 radical SAM protein [Pseudodonghicola flavimaris]